MRVSLLIQSEQGVLFVRHEKDGRSYWLLPGGGVEFGETLEETARREALEETGLEVILGGLALVWETLPPDRSRHVLNLCFAASVVGGALGVRVPDGRLQEARYLAPGELGKIAMHPPLAEPLLQYLADPGRPLVLGPRWTD